MRSLDALSACIRVIERDQLAAYVRIVDQLQGMTIGFEVDDESFFLAAGERLRIHGGIGDGSRTGFAAVRTDRPTILALVDGDIELLEAVESRRLHVLADISLMARLARAERAFAEGAARARRIRPILEAYRST